MVRSTDSDSLAKSIEVKAIEGKVPADSTSHLTLHTVSTQSATTVAFVCVLLTGAGFLFFVNAGEVVNLALKLLLIAVLALTLKRWTGAIVLALLQVSLFFLEDPQVVRHDVTTTLIWVVSGLALVASISRYRTLQEFEQESAVRLLPKLLQLRASVRNPIRRRAAEAARRSFMQIPRSVLQLAGCLFIATVLLWLVPLHRGSSVINTAREYGIIPTGYRTIMMGVLLFLLYLPIWLVINEVTWRRHTPAQSRLFLRTALIKWMHRDLRMVVRRSLRLRRRRSLKVGSSRNNDNAAEKPSELSGEF